MKIVPNRVFIILVVFLMQGTAVFAAPGPPPPSAPPPVGLPLDGPIFLFALFSVCFGIYKLNKIKNIKNASN
ncbi:hypothetical protein [Flavobacterium sp.]|jgi:hypothetical protein|uniref:hypothetical protein n=1 Tax=Flavobacterium sp. TaxID=239 RepID=UPI0037C1A847